MNDAHGHAPQVSPDETCRRIAQALIEENGWSLLSEQELAQRVLCAHPHLSPAAQRETRRLVQHQYTIALYEACRQEQNAARRECAYRELYRFLYRAATHRWPELAEDSAQRALVLVYEQIDRCRDPGAFVAFALFKLRHAIKQEQRARGQEIAVDEGLLAQISADIIPPAAQVDRQECCRALLAAIQRLRDKRERAAIAYRFLGGQSDAEIGKTLGITAGHVRVLRHRGLRRLRNDERLRAYVEQGESHPAANQRRKAANAEPAQRLC
jgi:RNA polymerase sigma factor (sigma-70 family)